MLNILFWVFIGMFIGWNIPQPPWARSLQRKALSFVRQLTSDKG